MTKTLSKSGPQVLTTVSKFFQLLILAELADKRDAVVC
jgi:hypothetical protein